MSNWIFVIAMILLGILSYFIGLTRGVKETEAEHLMDYDNGYNDALNTCAQQELADDIDTHLDNMLKEQRIRDKKARELIWQLDELFEDEEDKDIIDGGTY